ncbi:hypothetical protein HU200_058649 [Digitaria exilis]|uniref:Ribosomal protein S27 n=1 Tax=Digitaria exilis TaxID=1010633 RepID=A0A835ADK5_9POAL|nr:hypothetical protein HU200_058649 [Digitaria exilis]
MIQRLGASRSSYKTAATRSPRQLQRRRLPFLSAAIRARASPPRWYVPVATSSTSPRSQFARPLAGVLQNDIDLLNPPAELEKLKHKKKRLVQSPNSFFMTVVVCPGCQTVLCQPTGGKARLTEGCSFRRKGD